jgi:acetyltransferase-like isoleucine patch superfamily enzyme
METIIYKIYNILFNRPLLKLKLKKCGKNFKFGYRSELKNAQFFSIGDNFFSGPYGYFVTNKFIPVEIGNDVMFGPFCKMFGGDHDLKYNDNHIRFAPEKKVLKKKIIIENGVWVGANVTLLSKSFISEGSVISSGAIVNSYIPPYCIAYGIPAKKFKRRFNNAELKIALINVSSKYSISQIFDIYRKHEIDTEL